MKKKISLLLSALLIVFSIHAQWSTNPTDNNPIASLPGEQAIPKIATCSNGDTYIGFFSNETGNYNVRLQRLNSLGEAIWPSGGIVISTNLSDSWLTDWDMAADNAGHCILTWQDIRNGNNNAYAYRISPDGLFVWGNNGIALSNNNNFNASPKVVATSSGNAVFAWMSGDDIIIQKINPAGVKQWCENGITLSSSNTLSWPQMLPIGSDDIILKYFDDSGPSYSPTRHVYAQRYNASGTPVWTSPALISNAGGISAWTQIFPFINDGSDGFYIAWHDDRDNNMMASVWVNHVNSSGQVTWPANGVEASSASGYNHFYPELALPPGSQEVFVYWNEMNSLQSQKGIYGQKFSSSGTKLWGNNGMTFIPLSDLSITPLAARNTPTDMILLLDVATSGVNSSLYAMRIGTGGNYVWTDQQVPVSNAASSKVHPVINEFQDNQWIIAWEDNRNGASDIYAQNLLLDGTLGAWDPAFGSIQGQVMLNGGNGNVTQVLLTAGNVSTLPDPTGIYFMTVPTGTYTVTATLGGYYPGAQTGVVVLENQSTTGIDFFLDPMPTTGFISGSIILEGGNGSVTDVIVSSGSYSTSPDQSGYYTLEVPGGSWDVEASLQGYTPQIRSSITVTPGNTTPNVNFSLVPLPSTGYIQGYVSVEGNVYNLTEVTVMAGTQNTHPSENGFYYLELETGVYEVSANHIWTQIAVIQNVQVEPGLTTTDVNFNLIPYRRDLIVKATDQNGNAIYPCSIQINGPGQTYYVAMLLEDSVILSNVVYGYHQGSCIYSGAGTVFADTLVDGNNNIMHFHFVIDQATYQIVNPLLLDVIPNPSASMSVVKFTVPSSGNYHLSLISGSGSIISRYPTGIISGGTHRLHFTSITEPQSLKPGIYVIQLSGEGCNISKKILINQISH